MNNHEKDPIEIERRKFTKKLGKLLKLDLILRLFVAGCFPIIIAALIGLLWILWGSDIIWPLILATIIMVWLNS